jgi:hypothetical protein
MSPASLQHGEKYRVHIGNQEEEMTYLGHGDLATPTPYAFKDQNGAVGNMSARDVIHSVEKL